MPTVPIHALTLRQSADLLRRRGVQIDLLEQVDLLHPVARTGVPNTVFHDVEDGNLFTDSDDRTQTWFLPAFQLPGEIDAQFGFAASKTQQIDQETGAPFSKCRLTLTVQKIKPPDVVTWLLTHNADTLHEIPFDNLEAAIVVETVNSGVPVSTSCRATLTDQGDGRFLLVADAILGVQVLALYQNLTQTGAARCTFAATFQARRIKPKPPGVHTHDLRFDTGPVPFSQSLAIGTKYRADPYRLKYTVATNDTPRVIINVEDLRSFDIRQSEYIELRTLGDVTSRFPSISKLYFGVLSRTVVVIPNRYVILRNSGVCAAICNALVDSSPGLTAGCKFQFAFTLVPDVSPIDLILLTNEINARAETELRGADVHLPRSFGIDAGSRLMSPFLTSFSYAPGANDSESIDLSIEIREQLQGQPAIANANMFIGQLRATNGPFLVGSVGIRLDDAFAAQAVPIMLTFGNTQPLDAGGMTLTKDAQGNHRLQNGSAFNLLVGRVGVLTQNSVAILPVGETIAPSKSLALQLPADVAGSRVLVDCEIALANPFSKDRLFELLQFHAVDVQNTQYLFGVDGAGISFVGLQIDHLEIRITLAASPNVAIATMAVRKERRADSAQVLLPIDRVLVELKASALVTVSFIANARPPVSFTIENDFGQHPVLFLNDGNLHL